MAGFEVSAYGRIWVSTEGYMSDSWGARLQAIVIQFLSWSATRWK